MKKTLKMLPCHKGPQQNQHSFLPRLPCTTTRLPTQAHQGNRYMTYMIKYKRKNRIKSVFNIVKLTCRTPPLQEWNPNKFLYVDLQNRTAELHDQLICRSSQDQHLGKQLMRQPGLQRSHRRGQIL